MYTSNTFPRLCTLRPPICIGSTGEPGEMEGGREGERERSWYIVWNNVDSPSSLSGIEYKRRTFVPTVFLLPVCKKY